MAMRGKTASAIWRQCMCLLALMLSLSGCPSQTPDASQFGGNDGLTGDLATTDAGSLSDAAGDVGPSDSGPVDVDQPKDASAKDSKTKDATAVDAGAKDAGAKDAGAKDAGAQDVGTADTAVDTSTKPDIVDKDIGADSGAATSGCPNAPQSPKPRVPCRIATCTAGVCGGAKAPDGTACSAGKACKNGSCLGQQGWAQDVVAGNYFSCALLSSGKVACWGSNQNGQLGNGEKGIAKEQTKPVLVNGLSDITAVAADAAFACAVSKTGKVWCWGNNYWGTLGNGDSGPGKDKAAPGKIGMLDDAISVTSGERHGCALRAGGEIWCWGHNGDGQLGNGGTQATLGPIGAFGSDWVAVSAGGTNTCGIRADGSVACWGDNEYGQCANGQSGSQKQEESPVTVPGIVNAHRIAVGERHVCARTKSHEVWCWGGGLSGQVGDGNKAKVNTKPIKVKLPQTLEIAAGYLHTCVRTAANLIYCWGSNSYGQVGPGGSKVAEPLKQSGVMGATDVACGRSHSCMVRSDLSVWCWGDGGSGQLGNGGTKSSTAPVKVVQN